MLADQTFIDLNLLMWFVALEVLTDHRSDGIDRADAFIVITERTCKIKIWLKCDRHSVVMNTRFDLVLLDVSQDLFDLFLG